MRRAKFAKFSQHPVGHGVGGVAGPRRKKEKFKENPRSAVSPRCYCFLLFTFGLSWHVQRGVFRCQRTGAGRQRNPGRRCALPGSARRRNSSTTHGDLRRTGAKPQAAWIVGDAAPWPGPPSPVRRWGGLGRGADTRGGGRGGSYEEVVGGVRRGCGADSSVPGFAGRGRAGRRWRDQPTGTSAPVRWRADLSRRGGSPPHADVPLCSRR